MSRVLFVCLGNICRSPTAEAVMARLVADAGLDVPDPYHGGPGGFDHVLDLVEAACAGLLAELRAAAA
jgi:protein-tyrosine phosphatase